MNPQCHRLFGRATVTVAAPDIEISIIALFDDEGEHGAGEISVTNGTLQLAVAWSRLTSVMQGAVVTAATAGSSVGLDITLDDLDRTKVLV